MKIRKSSWHYRLARKMGTISNYEPYSLCVYFWKVVLACCIPPMMAIAGTIVFLLLTSPIWWLFFERSPGDVYVVGFVASIDIVLLLSVWREYRKELRFQGRIKPRVLKKPTWLVETRDLVVARLKAGKNKVCPLIEFTSDGK